MTRALDREGTLDAVLADSFPASDPPSWIPSTAEAGTTIRRPPVTTFSVGYFVGSLAKESINRKLANALVRLGPEGASARTPYLGGPNMQVHTDSAGRYSISNITAGAYTLTAIAPTVVARTPVPAGSGGITFGSAGIVGGSIGGGVTTETRNGVTIEYRDDYGTRVPITIGDASVDDLAVVVR